ncbi:protein SCAR2-like isoform X2 [Phragmites australis]|nr:protein SCAR2-like isoform X2 [Phragmites australis]
MLNLDLPAQQEDGERCGCGCGSDDKSRDFSCALEEELTMSPTHSVPKPPRYPLLLVTSHDRSMLRKAPTLVQPSGRLSDEKNTILDQIKNKSFNLKPVRAKRPNVMGSPRTNLQVVAILERAHAIRQVVADDDDEDSWSE